jgi:predicted nucleic acid-binding protein
MSDKLYLLDTTVVLTLVRGNALASHIDSTYGLRASRIRPLVSVVTHGEVRVLAGRNDWGAKRLTALQHALDNLVAVDINHPAVIDAYVEIDLFSQAHPSGSRNMGKNDLWIAACAKAADATLLTTDKDFGHLSPNLLKVELIGQAKVQPPQRDD